MNLKKIFLFSLISLFLFSCSQNNRRTADDSCEDGIQKMYEQDYAGAFKDFNKAIELDPNYAKSYYHRGCLQFNMQKRNEAIKDYTMAVKLDTNYADAYYNRGLTYFYNGQRFYACQDWLKAYSLGKANIEERLRWCK